MEEKVLGIDFGTSFSSVSVLFHGQIKVVQDENGNTNIPSVVCFRENEKVGASANILRTKYPKNTIYEIKRVVGCRYDDAVVQHLKNIWQFNLIEASEHRVQVEFYVNDKRRRYFPEYVISKILNYLVKLAEGATGEKFEKAVITVPANFNDTQRKCIRIAARFANLEVLRIMDEPVAAAVAISIQTNIDNSRVLVYDMGGGTFDISILEVTVNDYRVIATDGDPCLGGADFTNALMDIARRKIAQDQNVDTRRHPRLEVEMRSLCENIKMELSTVETTSMDLDLSRYGGIDDYQLVITRVEFEEVIRESIARSVEIVRSCMSTYNIAIDTVSGIALVGGSSYIPLIRKELLRVFPTLCILDGYDPREVVCRGALVQALTLVADEAGYNPVPIPVAPAPISNNLKPRIGNEPVVVQPVIREDAIHRPSDEYLHATEGMSSLRDRLSIQGTLPRAVPLASTNHYDPVENVYEVTPQAGEGVVEMAVDVAAEEVLEELTSVYPMDPVPVPVPVPVSELEPEPEVVAVPHPFAHVVIHPTTPLDLGIRVRGKFMDVIIERNLPLPISRTKTYIANREHPDCVRCCIYQGNSELVAQNAKIGIIMAKNIPVQENVRSMISITFSIDINGVFSASAVVVGSNTPVQIEMLDSVLLTDEMVDVIKEEAANQEREMEMQLIDELKGEVEMRLVELENCGDEDVEEIVQSRRDWLERRGENITVGELESCLYMLKNL